MLARSIQAIAVSPNVETEIVSWTADGTKELIGFTATGSWSAEFRLYVGDDPSPWYVYQTSPGNRTAYIADRGIVLPQGTRISLKVIHDSIEGSQTFHGTLLGG